MSIEGARSDKIKARLALFQNPYLFLDLEEAAVEESPKQLTLQQKRVYFTKLQDPYAYYDVFGDPDDSPTTPETRLPSAVEIVHPSREIAKAADDAVVSKDNLEKLLDDVMRLYKPYVARTDWARVTEYRSEFLVEASRTPTVAHHVARRLQELKFSLMPGEKVEYNRAPAERIINELKRLLA